VRRNARGIGACALVAAASALCFAAPAMAAAPACSKAAARHAVIDTSFARKVKSTLGSAIFRPGETVLGLFKITTVICADVTGDGAKEMVVSLQCCTASSPSPWAIFKAGSGRWALRYSRIKTITARLRVDPHGDVEEKSPRYAPDDPFCCPSSYRYVRAHWTGTAFTTLRGQA
jgi:hypothetical protein